MRLLISGHHGYIGHTVDLELGSILGDGPMYEAEICAPVGIQGVGPELRGSR